MPKNIKLFKFEPSYDAILDGIKKKRKNQTWKQIAAGLAEEIDAQQIWGANRSAPSGKQCRERWYNYIDDSVNREPLTSEERKYIKKHGGTAAVARELNHPENQVKNAYHSMKNVHKKKKVALSSKPTPHNPPPRAVIDISPADRATEAEEELTKRYSIFTQPIEFDLQMDEYPGLEQLAQKL